MIGFFYPNIYIAIVTYEIFINYVMMIKMVIFNSYYYSKNFIVCYVIIEYICVICMNIYTSIKLIVSAILNSKSAYIYLISANEDNITNSTTINNSCIFALTDKIYSFINNNILIICSIVNKNRISTTCVINVAF